MTVYFEFLMQRPVKQRYHDVGQPAVHRHRDAPTRVELGFGKKRNAKAAKLSEIPDRRLDQTTKALIADGKPVNPNTVLAARRANGGDHFWISAAQDDAGTLNGVTADIQRVGRFLRGTQICAC